MYLLLTPLIEVDGIFEYWRRVLRKEDRVLNDLSLRGRSARIFRSFMPGRCLCIFQRISENSRSFVRFDFKPK